MFSIYLESVISYGKEVETAASQGIIVVYEISNVSNMKVESGYEQTERQEQFV